MCLIFDRNSLQTGSLLLGWWLLRREDDVDLDLVDELKLTDFHSLLGSFCLQEQLVSPFYRTDWRVTNNREAKQ